MNNIINLTVLRYNDKPNYTDGLLFIEDQFECYTLEDGKRSIKVYGETRIDDGTYKIEYRKVGGFHNRYINKFGNIFHKGMLHITNVPNFEYILIHIGNDNDDTDGCLLVGSTADKDKGFIGNSTKAYKSLYRKISKYLDDGNEVYITFKTL